MRNFLAVYYKHNVVNLSDRHVRVSASVVVDGRISMMLSSSDRPSCSRVFILVAAGSRFLHTDNQWSGFLQYLQVVPTAWHLVWFASNPQRVHVLFILMLVFCLRSIRILLSCFPIPDFLFHTKFRNRNFLWSSEQFQSSLWHFILTPNVKGLHESKTLVLVK